MVAYMIHTLRSSRTLVVVVVVYVRSSKGTLVYFRKAHQTHFRRPAGGAEPW